MNGFFFTGTDTAVGKTHVAAMTVRALRRAGVDAAGFKPLCCGDRGDALALAEASGGLPVNDVNPVWLRPPVAPYTAAMIEGRVIDLALVRDAFTRLREKHTVIVEGAGGWFVPVTRDFSMADLAVEFALPVIIVVANRLGCINHTLLTVRAVQAAGLECRGVILNHTTPAVPGDAAVLTNCAVLEDVLNVPVLAEVEHGMCEFDSVKFLEHHTH